MTANRLTAALGIALFLSLVGNLLLGGMMLGRSYSHGWERGDWRARDAQLKKELSPADYAIVKKGMDTRRSQFRELRGKLDEAREAVARAGSAQPLDQAVLDEALREEYRRKTELLKVMRETREAISAKLSPEGRKIFEKTRSRHRDRGHWHGHGHGGDRGEKPRDGRPPGEPPPSP